MTVASLERLGGVIKTIRTILTGHDNGPAIAIPNKSGVVVDELVAIRKMSVLQAGRVSY